MDTSAISLSNSEWLGCTPLIDKLTLEVVIGWEFAVKS